MQKFLSYFLLFVWCSNVMVANADEDTPPPPKDAYVEIKKATKPSPRSLVDVVAVATVFDSVVAVTFIEQLGDVVVRLSDVSGELDYAVTHTANGSVLMMLPADASGEIAIVITDAAGNQYVGLFTI